MRPSPTSVRRPTQQGTGPRKAGAVITALSSSTGASPVEKQVFSAHHLAPPTAVSAHKFMSAGQLGSIFSSTPVQEKASLVVMSPPLTARATGAGQGPLVGCGEPLLASSVGDGQFQASGTDELQAPTFPKGRIKTQKDHRLPLKFRKPACSEQLLSRHTNALKTKAGCHICQGKYKA